ALPPPPVERGRSGRKNQCPAPPLLAGDRPGADRQGRRARIPLPPVPRHAAGHPAARRSCLLAGDAPMSGLDVVELSRLQFALTALYHFLFVPLTLGLSVLLAIMESVYVMTGRRIWRDITMFWGILFGINFAMAVATGITMEFQ